MPKDRGADIIPITRGKEIAADSMIEKVKSVRQEAESLLGRVYDLLVEKEEEIKQETDKQAANIDFELVSLLEGDKEILKQIEDQLLNQILTAFDKEAKLRELSEIARIESEILDIQNTLQQLKQQGDEND